VLFQIYSSLQSEVVKEFQKRLSSRLLVEISGSHVREHDLGTVPYTGKPLMDDLGWAFSFALSFLNGKFRELWYLSQYSV
jgi:hypothetical protein